MDVLEREASMIRSLGKVLVGVALFITGPCLFGQTDIEGSKDYPGISRMPNYYIYEYQDTPFDAYEFRVADGDSWKEQTVEGHRVDIRYNLKDNAQAPSQLQVVRNYQNAARANGGKILYSATEATTICFNKDGKETWLSIEVGNIPSGTFIMMVIVEKQAMQQDVTIDAKGMARDISENGRVALYGIYFDTGKSEIKPESAPALSEIAVLLKSNADLKVYVVGHTDMTADLATNMKLSQARAQAVVGALVSQYGVVAAQMIPYGAGPYSPVASNKTENGRALNRRVELVEIATK
jgi:OmpA-OmpF porin, OOP family